MYVSISHIQNGIQMEKGWWATENVTIRSGIIKMLSFKKILTGNDLFSSNFSLLNSRDTHNYKFEETFYYFQHHQIF